MSEKFTVINESFVCENCGTENYPAEKTCRNHCVNCLFSKHVDEFPGDRSATCHGAYVPQSVEFKGAEMKSIIFKCARCGKTGKNKIASDDNRESLYGLMGKF